MSLIKKALKVIFLISFFVSSLTFAREKIVIENHSADEEIKIDIIESTSSFTKFKILIPSYFRSNTFYEGINYDKISIENFVESSDPGSPNLPVLGRMLAVPYGAEIKVDISDIKYIDIDNIYLEPVKYPQAESGEIHQQKINETIYQANQYYPEKNYLAEPIKIIRGCPVTTVWIYPVQFNPVERRARLFSEFTVTINFINGSDYFFNPRYDSPYFSKIFERLIQNWNIAKENAKMRESIENEEFDFFNGCDYLIVTHREFSEAADSLALWKRLCGLRTRIVYVEDLDNSAEEIKAFIQNGYDNWHIPPTFVLFLGDAEFVPTNYQTEHPDESGRIGTDLYYATVDGSDYFPDIITGRIPVQNHLQALVFIKKIIEYEKYPVTDPMFYQNVIVAAYFQDNDNLDTPNYNERDGYEDRRFVLTSEEIRDLLISSGYNATRIYNAESAVNPTNYNNGSYANGEPIPDELLRANGFLWNGNAENISAIINNGCFLVSHRDHGSRDGWGDPEYNSSDVRRLSNRSKLPVVLSINCATGWYDNETDDEVAGTSINSECFVEEWVRNFNGGAVGVFGSTRISYSGYNDVLAKGFFDAIFPQFLDFNSGAEPTYVLGNVLNYGKLVLASEYDANTTRKVEFEEFHFFGDPAMAIWTQYPNELVVEADDSCYLNQTFYAVFTNPGNSTVTLVQNNEIVATAISDDNGHADLHFSPISSFSNLALSVTKPNHKPWRKEIKVYAKPDYAISLESINIIDQDQNNQVNIGETIHWQFTVRNESVFDLENVNFQLVTSDSFINLVVDDFTLDSLSADQEITISELSFTVNPHCPDAHYSEMEMRIFTSSDTTIYPLNFTVFEGAPRIEVSPASMAFRVDSINDSVMTSIVISNNGFGPLTYHLKDETKELFSVGDTTRKWWTNSPDGTGNIYQAKKLSNLLRFNFYLNIISPITAHFFVYEGEQLLGTYYKIAQSSRNIEDLGNDLFWSDIFNITMEQDKFYYFGISWNGGDAQICRSNEYPPVDLSFGSLETGAINLGGVPPADSINQTFGRLVCFVQQTEIGEGTWLEISDNAGELSPAETVDITLKLKPENPDTTYFKNLNLISTDLTKDSISIPIYLTTKTDSINFVLSIEEILDDEGNKNQEINTAEIVTLPVTIHNIGTDTLDNLTLKFVTDDTIISINDSSEIVNSLAPNSKQVLPSFEFEVSPYCIRDHNLIFDIETTNYSGYDNTFSFQLPVVESFPEIQVFEDTIKASFDILHDSLQTELEIANNGYGRLIYQLINPSHSTIPVGTPSEAYWLPLNNGVGNIYLPILAERLQRIETYFEVNAPGSVYFFIYEGDSLGGEFYLKYQKLANVFETGKQWIDSGPIDFVLKQNKYYYIGNSWEGDIKISKANEAFPYDLNFGIIYASTFNFGGFPPEQEIDINRQSPLLISQKLIVGSGLWLEMPTAADTIYPGQSKFVPIELTSSIPDTIINTELSIESNDITDATLSIPVKINITAPSTEVRDEINQLPDLFTLNQNYPNPFNPSTTIRFSLNKKGNVDLTIYNLLGQKVKTLISATKMPGSHSVSWDGIDSFGKNVSTGVYFAVMRFDNKTLKKKVLMIK